MTVATLTATDLSRQLRHAGICLRTGPIRIRIRSAIPAVAEGLHTLYSDYPLDHEPGFIDFHVKLVRPGNVRRWWRPQVLFLQDGHSPFKPLPLSQAFPMLEWGLNWCMANYLHHYLILHAAVVERDGLAVILPGEPGAGKSTLCAALAHHGWRLLSDEMTIISLQDGRVIPNPRPVSLKNESIVVIRDFAPQARLGRDCIDTRKGTVAHMKAPADSVARAGETALPAWVIAPSYQADAPAVLEEESKARMFMLLVRNAFNYNVLGVRAFHRLNQVMAACQCYRLTYSRLDQAVGIFNALTPATVNSLGPYANQFADPGTTRA